MRGIVYKHRKKRLLAVAMGLSVVYFLGFSQMHWVRDYATRKVEDFMGDKLTVEIGSINGGLFWDMTLQDVAFYAKGDQEDKVFRLERMEISYRIWSAILEKLGLARGQEHTLKYIGMYFSRENPFLRGFLKLYSYPDRIEIVGHVSPLLFGKERRRGVKGVFMKREDSSYDCDLLWDGKLKVTGILAPQNRELSLEFTPLEDRKGLVKISGAIEETGDIRVYSRLDKVSVLGPEIIGDFWLDYRDSELPEFSVRCENLLVNKMPLWDFKAKARFDPRDKTVFLDEVAWGKGIIFQGKVAAKEPYPADIKLLFKSLQLEDVTEMFGRANEPLSGKVDGEIVFIGPLKEARVDGRLYIAEGIMGEMQFKSVFASLKGKLPVVRVVDARAVKECGNIIIAGEMDFSKFREGKTFEGVLFDTDNKVAVW